ncbi:MAG: hypothetical protein JXQ27_13370 [Acidobacteria bacterium]|nr:hypothetical protein [Acidobacteriota bacterium]
MTNPFFPVERESRWRRTRRWFGRIWEKLQPGPEARRHAAWGLLVVLFILVTAIAAVVPLGIGAWFDPPAAFIIMLIISALVGLLVVIIVKLTTLIPRFFSWTGLLLAGGIIGAFSLFIPPPMGPLLGAVVAAGEAIFAAAIGAVTRWDFFEAPPARKSGIIALITLGVALNIAGVCWLFQPGSDDHLVPPPEDTTAVRPLDLPDPGAAGPYEVAELTYGSGVSRRRPEFGEGAELQTETVNASPFTKGSTGWIMRVRQWLEGFDMEHVPLNGRVWYPRSAGRFPLVLMVHGNHNMAEDSDPGYAYLGRHLAGRGFIAVTVDENFFNSSFVGGPERENDARGWLLLKHLEVWRKWNKSEGNPFQGKVDLEHIALIGHSRGGEAAAIAGAFNRLPCYPDDAKETFDFNFNIRGIIAIAPSDGQYSPAGRPTPLENVNYMVLQGAHDSDVSIFVGTRQYQRVRFHDDRYWFKSSIYVYRANHGQFNTVWGDSDWGWPTGLFLNRQPLHPAADQERIGKVFMTAFLEAALHENLAYVDFLRDHRRGRDWLPVDHYVTRFADSTRRLLADFEEDVDLTTAARAGARLAGENLDVWHEERVTFRSSGSQENNAVSLGWRWAGDAPDPARVPGYVLRVTAEQVAELGLDDTSRLVFAVANPDEKVPEEDDTTGEAPVDDGDETDPSSIEPSAAAGEKAVEKGESDTGEKAAPPDMTLQLVLDDGTAVSRPLSSFRRLPPVLKSQFTRLPPAESLFGQAWEVCFQTCEIPLAAFRERNPSFAPERLREIRFVFDRTPEAVILLDNVGFAK